MDLLIRISAYLIILVLLLWANVWFLRTVYAEFSPAANADVIAPFEVIGQDNPRLGVVLARMLQSQLAEIQRTMEASAATLKAAERVTSAQARIQDLSQPKPVQVPLQVFDPVNVNIKVGSVEVGGLFEWLQKRLVRDRRLQLAVHYDGDKALTVGNLDLAGQHSLWLETGKNNQDIIKGVAYHYVQHQFVGRIPQLGALTPSEFQTLLTAIKKLVELNTQLALGRANRDEYSKLQADLQPIVDRLPQWQPLLRLTAEVAENASNPEKALALYRAELEITPDGARSDLHTKIDSLSELLAAREVVADPGEDIPITATSGNATKWEKRIRDLVAADALVATSDIRIGILGGVPPPNHLPAAQMTVVGTQRSSDKEMAEYTGTVADAVRLIAHDAHFFFTAVGSEMRDADILSALDRLLTVKPHILVITLGPLGREFEPVVQRYITQGTLVVVAAGNEPREPAPFAGGPLADRLLVAAAVNEQGQMAAFTTRDKNSFWAPGVAVPVRAAGGKVEARDGTSYSAAIAAGVAAQIMGGRKDLGVSDLLRHLREASRPIAENGPAVINLKETRARLR
jgi:hypothetical protein